MVYSSIIFYWRSGPNCTTSLELNNRTLEDALRLAESAGWSPCRWYRPSTWGNYYFGFVSKGNRQA